LLEAAGQTPQRVLGDRDRAVRHLAGTRPGATCNQLAQAQAAQLLTQLEGAVTTSVRLLVGGLSCVP
jgi:hypothetical protein